MPSRLPLRAPDEPLLLGATVPIVALDVPDTGAAMRIVDALPSADFFKVGLQLYTAEGPGVVGRLKDSGKRVFLDLKLHDIPNTVAGAVRSATALGVDILTVHALGGRAMLEAAATAASAASPRLFAVTVLTSHSAEELARTWGRSTSSLSLADEATRLARTAADAGLDGVVTSVHEVAAIRAATSPGFPVLTPGIRLPGDAAGDQARVATPADAARLGVDYVVVGRSVTAAERPADAFDRLLVSLSHGATAAS
ncbi:MAG: orotidine-5'-phosphate decarboxylase [Gemmatimonadota bacterium]